MKEIHDIFSKSKEKNNNQVCPNPKTKIIVDTREKQSLVVANLFNKKANIDFEKLDIGDFLINETVIERKTYPDLINSIIDKRLTNQLNELRKYPSRLLIIENFNNGFEEKRIHQNAIKGMLLSISLDFKTPIIFTKDEEDTSIFLILIAKKYEKEKSIFPLRPSKTLKTLDEQKQFILEGFPGIGPTLSKNLLQNFQSLKDVFSAKEDELQRISGLDKNKIKKFRELLDL